MYRRFILVIYFLIWIQETQSKTVNINAINTSNDDITIHLNTLFDQYYNSDSRKKKQLAIAKKYLALAKKGNEPKYLITGYTLVANSLNYKKGKKYIDSLSNIDCINDQDCVLLKLSNRGAFFYQNKYYREALDEYIKANSYFRKLKTENTDLHLTIKDAIARIKNIQGRTHEALKIYLENEKYLRNSIGTSNQKLYTECLFSITECYNRLQSTTKNCEIINKGLALTKNSNDNNGYNYFIFAQAKNNYNLKQYEVAAKQFNKVLSLFLKNDDYINYAESCFYIGKIYELKKNKKLAITYYTKVDSVLNQRNYAYTELKNIYPYLIKYFEDNGNLTKCFYFSKQLIKADSITQRNYEYVVDKTHKEFDIPEMEEKKEKEFSIIKISFATILIVILIITVILGYLFNKHWKRKKIQLNEQYHKFQKLLIEKETLESRIDYLEYSKVNKQEPQINTEISTEHRDKSVLDAVLTETILRGLNQFEKEHRYINPECSLDLLANELNTNTTYLSRVINHHKQTNFSNYIHYLRIKLFVQLLNQDKKYLNYSIQALALEIGYKNHSTFTRIFNTKAGITPSMYIKAFKEDKKLDNL